MKLSKVERLILANQYRILARLDESNAGWCERMREALESGYEGAYSGLFNAIFDGLSAEQCSFVIRTMDMYNALQRSYTALADKSGIDERSGKFPGFDGNNETEHMGYAEYVVEQEDRFPGLQLGGDRFNSHTRSIPRYRAMLAVWRELGESYELSKDQMRHVLDARPRSAPGEGPVAFPPPAPGRS